MEKLEGLKCIPLLIQDEKAYEAYPAFVLDKKRSSEARQNQRILQIAEHLGLAA